MNTMIILYVLLVIGITSCKDEPKPPYSIPQNAVTLLTADSIKSWKIARRYNGKTRMNMGDCFLGYRQRFATSAALNAHSSGLVEDNIGALRNCGPSFKAIWQITTSDQGAFYLNLTIDQIP